MDERGSRIRPCWLNHAPIERTEQHLLLDCDEARRLRVVELLRYLQASEQGHSRAESSVEGENGDESF
jgi:hypothetical protein